MASSRWLLAPPSSPDRPGDKAVDKTAHKTKLHSTYEYKGDKQWDGNIYTFI